MVVDMSKGRKPIGDVAKSNRPMIRLDDEEFAMFQELGGVAWVRSELQNAIQKKKTGKGAKAPVLSSEQLNALKTLQTAIKKFEGII